MPQPSSQLSASGVMLAIETSNPSAAPAGERSCGVCVGRVGDSGINFLAEISIDGQGSHDDVLMSTVAAACEAARVRPRDIATIAVSAGPGGYTAVRLAITTAKLIAEATGARCIAVPTASALAGAFSPDAAGPFAVALASKGTSTHITIFDRAGNVLKPGVTCTPEAFDASGVTALIADRFLPTGFVDAAAACGLTIVPPRFSARAVALAAAHFEPVDPAQLGPIYPRVPEAVTKWQQLKDKARA
jgi:tRNA threonylcarbamoyladenosine biosynthesis protein TsaB